MESALPDDDDPARHVGHVNILTDELARLFGPISQTVREQAAEAALVSRHASSAVLTGEYLNGRRASAAQLAAH